MNKKLLIVLMAIGVALVFVATGLQAGTKVADTFKMESKEYKSHKKGIVEFSHKKHNVDYKISCGECHHDKDNKPLTLKMGDDVQRCVECHTKLKKSKEDKKNINVHQNALHENCKSCHKKVNIKAGDPKGRKGPAPNSCTKCHPKTKK
jgi:hypothetical protein